MANYCKVDFDKMDKLVAGFKKEFPDKTEAEVRELINSTLNKMIKRRNETGRKLVKDDVRSELKKATEAYMSTANALEKAEAQKLYVAIFGGTNDSLYDQKFSYTGEGKERSDKKYLDALESWKKNGNVLQLSKQINFNIDAKGSSSNELQDLRSTLNADTVQGSWEAGQTKEDKLLSIASAFGLDTTNNDVILNAIDLSKNEVAYQKTIDQKNAEDIIKNSIRYTDEEMLSFHRQKRNIDKQVEAYKRDIESINDKYDNRIKNEIKTDEANEASALWFSLEDSEKSRYETMFKRMNAFEDTYGSVSEESLNKVVKESPAKLKEQESKISKLNEELLTIKNKKNEGNPYEVNTKIDGDIEDKEKEIKDATDEKKSIIKTESDYKKQLSDIDDTPLFLNLLEPITREAFTKDFVEARKQLESNLTDEQIKNKSIADKIESARSKELKSVNDKLDALKVKRNEVKKNDPRNKVVVESEEIDPTSILVELEEPKKALLSRSLETTLEPGQVIKLEDFAKDYKTINGLIEAGILKTKGEYADFMLSTEESYNEYLKNVSEGNTDKKVIDKFISSFLELSPEYSEIRYTSDEVYNSLQANSMSGIRSTIEGTSAAAEEKDKLLAEKQKNSKYISHSKVIKSIIRKSGEPIYDPSGKLVKFINGSLKSEQESEIASYINEHYDEYTDLDGNDYYKDSSTGEVITNNDFVNMCENIFKSNSNTVIISPEIKHMTSEDIGIYNDLPSSVGEKILSGSMGKRTNDIREKEWELTNVMSDLSRDMTVINNAMRSDKGTVSSLNLKMIYDRMLDTAVSNGNSETKIVAGVLSEAAGDSFDVYNPSDFQSVMSHMVNNDPRVGFLIDVSEKELTKKQDTIFSNFQKGKDTYLTADFVNKTISYNAVINADVIPGRPKKNQSMNASSYSKWLIDIEKDPDVIKATKAERWADVKVMKNKKYQEYIAKNPKTLLTPGKPEMTKDTYSINTKTLFTHNLGTADTSYRQSTIDEFYKKQLEGQHLSSKEFRSLNLKRKIVHVKKELDSHYKRSSRLQTELVKLHRNLDSSTIQLYKDNAPSLLTENRMYVPTKGKESEAAIATKRYNEFLSDYRLGKGEVRYVSKADNNIINAKNGSWKDVTIEQTESGKQFTFMNNKDKSTGKPVMVRVWLDKFSDNGNDMISIQMEGNAAGKTAKKYFSADEEGYSVMSALHDYNNTGTTRNQKDISIIKKSIKLINKKFANEVKSTIYNVATKSAKTLEDASTIVKNVVDNQLLQITNDNTKDMVDKTKDNAHKVIDAVFNHKDITQIGTANEILQKISIEVVGKPNALHELNTDEMTNKSILIANAISHEQSGLTASQIELIKDLGDNSRYLEKDRPFDEKWYKEKVKGKSKELDDVADIIDNKETDIYNLKKENKLLIEERKMYIRTNEIEQAVSVDSNIKSNQKKISELSESVKKYHKSYDDLLNFINNAYATGTEAREKLSMNKIKDLIESGKWQPGTKAYKPVFEVDKVTGKRTYVGEEKLFDANVLLYDDMESQPDYDTKESSITGASAESYDKNDYEAGQSSVQNAKEENETTAAADKSQQEQFVVDSKVNTKERADESLEDDSDIESKTKKGFIEGDKIIMEDVKTREGKIPTRISELRLDDISTFSRVIRWMDHLTKSDLKYNEELSDSDKKDTDLIDPEQYQKRMNTEEANGSYTFNRHRKPFEYLETIFNMMEPEMQKMQSMNSFERRTVDMMDAEASVRWSEETSNNKGFKCN